MTLMRVVAILFTTFVALAALYIFHYNPLGFDRPKDKELITLFQKHRQDFEQLRRMGEEDAKTISYISEDTLGSSSLSKSRTNDYRRLLLDVGHGLSMRLDPNQISFPISGGGVGLAISRSWMKGITYLPNETRKIGAKMTNSLDSVSAKNEGMYLMPIEGNWYLVYLNID